MLQSVSAVSSAVLPDSDPCRQVGGGSSPLHPHLTTSTFTPPTPRLPSPLANLLTPSPAAESKVARTLSA